MKEVENPENSASSSPEIVDFIESDPTPGDRESNRAAIELAPKKRERDEDRIIVLPKGKEIKPLKLEKIELNGELVHFTRKRSRERVKELTEEGLFVAFDFTVGVNEESSVTSELNRAELVTQGRNRVK